MRYFTLCRFLPAHFDLGIGEKTFQRAGGDRFIELPSLAVDLTGMGADPSQHSGQGSGLPEEIQCLLELTFSHVLDIAFGIHSGRAGNPAGCVALRHTKGHRFVSVELSQLFDGTELQGPHRAAQHTDRLESFFQPVHAHGTFGHLLCRVIRFKLRGAIGTGFETFSLPGALSLVHQDSPVFFVLADCPVGTGFYAGGFLAMKAHDRKGMDLDIREGPLLPLVDPQPFGGAWFYVMPLLAGIKAGVAADTAAQVDKETILRHVTSPLKGSKSMALFPGGHYPTMKTG